MESERPSLAYQIFEKTGEKLYEVYDYVVRNPSLVKISRHKKVNKTKFYLKFKQFTYSDRINYQTILTYQIIIFINQKQTDMTKMMMKIMNCQ